MGKEGEWASLVTLLRSGGMSSPLASPFSVPLPKKLYSVEDKVSLGKTLSSLGFSFCFCKIKSLVFGLSELENSISHLLSAYVPFALDLEQPELPGTLASVAKANPTDISERYDPDAEGPMVPASDPARKQDSVSSVEKEVSLRPLCLSPPWN